MSEIGVSFAGETESVRCWLSGMLVQPRRKMFWCCHGAWRCPVGPYLPASKVLFMYQHLRVGI